MKIYETNAGLGFNQLAYLIQINNNDYLCIDTIGIYQHDDYYAGNIIKDLEDYYLTESNYKLEKSPIYNDFLFKEFLKRKIDTTKEYIICSAIHFDNDTEYLHQPVNIKTGIVITGRGHHNCYTTLAYVEDGMGYWKSFDKGAKGQGFLTSENRFLNRKEAYIIAVNQKQIKEKNIKIELFSKNIY